MKDRLVEIDLLRGAAIVAVVAIHVTSSLLQLTLAKYAPTHQTVFQLQVINQFFRYATPLFLILSGITLTLSQIHRPLTAGRFLQKRFIRIIIPYVSWSLFVVAISNPFDWYLHLRSVGMHLLWGTAEYHLYFVLLLLQLYFIFPFYFRLFAIRTAKGRVIILSLILVSQAVALGLYYWSFAMKTVVNEELLFRFFLYWQFYFAAGIVVAFHADRIIHEIRKVHTWVWVLLMLGVVALLVFEVRVFAIPYYSAVNFFRPTVMLYALISCVALLSITYDLMATKNRYLKAFQRGLARLGKHSLGIFLIHVTILTLLLAQAQWEQFALFSTVALTSIVLGICVILLFVARQLIHFITTGARKALYVQASD